MGIFLYLPDIIRNKEVKATHGQGYYRSRVFQEVEVRRFRDIRHKKVVSFSVLHTGRLYPPPQKIFLFLLFVRGRVDPSAMLRPERLFQRTISVTQSRKEPATFRFVAQCHMILKYVTSILTYKKILV